MGQNDILDSTREILIIDDDQSVLDSMCYYLEDCGFRVSPQSDGARGIARFEHSSADCVLTDLRMPGVSGLHVIEAIASKSPETPIIVISGADDVLGVSESFRLGAWDYLAKPLKDLSFLKLRIDSVLEKARLRRENARYQESLEEMVKERTAELWRIRVGLEDTVARRTQELEKALRRIDRDERIRSLSRMVAGVAHELNTPLGVAVSAVTNIEDLLHNFDHQKDEDVSGEARKLCIESIQLAHGNLKKMDQLIRRFRSVVKSGESETQQDVHLQDLVRIILRDMSPQLDAAGLTVEVDIPENIVFPSYPLSILSVLDELISNSVFHGYENRKSGTLSISIGRSEQSVVIEVADDGIGMEPEVSARIFEPFYTVSHSAERSGLGLNAVWNTVVNQLGGTLECVSRPNEGTRFTLRLSGE